MRFTKAILLMALVSALSVYAVECPSAVTPMQMMQCCKTMPCPHGKNCCKAKAASHSPFINVSAQKVAAPSVVLAAISTARQVRAADGAIFSEVIARPHAPPGSLFVISVPLRI